MEMSEMCEAIEPLVRPLFTHAEAAEFDELVWAGEFEFAFEVASLVKHAHMTPLPEQLLEAVRDYLEDEYRTDDCKIDQCYPELTFSPPTAEAAAA